MNKSSAAFTWLTELAKLKPEELLATIKKEFETIPGGIGDTKIARSRVGSKIQGLCRYPHIPCFEHSLVASREASANNAFVHANYVNFPNSPCKFIASMAPEDEPSKISVFWTMIRKQNVTLVICLTDIKEGDRLKSAKYWPDLGKEVDYDGIKVKTVNSTQRNGCIVSTINVKDSLTDVLWTIDHWYYPSWPDHSGPAMTDNIMAMVQNLISSAPKACLVHCSAGVGRTGTFLCAVMLATKILANEKPDIGEALRTVRKQRAWSVQRLPQYVFLYDFCVAYILEKCDLGKEEKEKLRNKMSFLKGSNVPNISPGPSFGPPSSPLSDKPKPQASSTTGAKAIIQKAAEYLTKSKLPKNEKSPAKPINKSKPEPKK